MTGSRTARKGVAPKTVYCVGERKGKSEHLVSGLARYLHHFAVCSKVAAYV